ncbi:MAG: helix-hairpin-helix domain-containing protein [Syntrophobacteraceae bacterium]|jgi:competence protein ComEA|nr:helix-hairpin-helix domain-containing protein [Syntrophobacteraceae bacterium]
MLKRVIPARTWAAITLMAALIASLLLLRAWRLDRPPDSPSPPPVIVEVLGDVPYPGIHILSPTGHSVTDALAAAGWSAARVARLSPEGIGQRPLATGQRIRIARTSSDSGEVVLEEMAAGSRFILGFKLDLNTASEEDLLRVPLMKPEWARAIVQSRQHEPWRSLDQLTTIHGIGAKTVEKWRPHLEAIPPSP